MSRRVRKSVGKKRTPRQVNRKTRAAVKGQKKKLSLFDAICLNGPKMKRTIINEYATNKQSMPVLIDNPLDSNDIDMVDVEKSNQFYSTRSIQPVDKCERDGDLNIKVTVLEKNAQSNSRIATCVSEENIKNLNNLSITDVTSFRKNDVEEERKNSITDNRFQNQSEPIEIFDTPVEILDLSSVDHEPLLTTVPELSNVNLQQISITKITPNKKPRVENKNEIIVLDETVQISDSDSDVEFISGKRKSFCQVDPERKRLKYLDTIVIADERRKRRRRQRQRRSLGRSVKKFNLLDLSAITGGNSTRLKKVVNPCNYIPLSSSTPNSSLVGTENAVMPCMCKGPFHSCALKPNLETIPEEVDKNGKNLCTRRNYLQMCDLSPCKPLQEPQNLQNKCALNQLGNFAQSTPQQKYQNIQNNNVNRQLEESLREYDDELNVFGSNFLNGGEVRTVGLRPIFIDGSNVAIGHSNGKYFSVKGLKICIDYFKMRGHEVTAIVPRYRMKWKQNSDSALLEKLEKDGDVVFTPSRTINGKNIVPYDDRFLVLMAAVYKGIIVSSDNFKDLIKENPYLRDTIENRVLNPTWMKDMIIFPEDPLGRYGPKLKTFLSFP